MLLQLYFPRGGTGTFSCGHRLNLYDCFPYLEVSSMKAWICLPLIALVLTGCAGKTAYRDSCGTQLDAAWHELDLAKAEGFAGTVSYSKALSLLTGAKTQQQFEAFEGCTNKAEKARFYIRESRAGR
ncbi:putative lipoprotein [Pseudomonas protegens CHA0]|nr:putative lipoprotein [Pseudomonas protegens CHA0]